ncbi:MAG: hypothetical protein UU74_C0025G0020 [Candidatus Woesebacteria bacterium GW2011_GWA1_41_7]|uniref:DUF8173 domain-containing protein n=1 Tax=Candidatus Woesebacteria bacterium GW2011_GWA1_41_7 TaxID=1618556 RepID=A0A0G0WWY6_9BACT|nr:MAG: hypothetical protein UU74_C0025G0020 [Candidatus Woesebacteria bacterium GW2011_GWA1_41_7]
MRKFIYSLMAFIVTFFVVSATNVSAKTLVNEEGSVSVSESEIINDDLFIGAQIVTLDGSVNGDVFIGADSVTVNGIINGNLHVGAGTVILNGNVKGNVYVGSENLSVNASTIGGSLILGAGNANIDKDSSIGGSIIAGAANITIDSQVKRSVYLGVRTATLGSTASIGKDLYYGVAENGQKIVIQDGAVITGETHKYEGQVAKPFVVREQVVSGMRFAKIFTTILSFLGALIVGLLYSKLFKDHFAQSAGFVSKSFWKSFGVGFLIAIAALPALVITIITVVGIPLAGVTFLILILGMYLAKIVVGFSLGAFISTMFNWKKMPTFATFALGLLVFYLLKIIPFIGGFVSITVLWAGLGALALHTFSAKK